MERLLRPAALAVGGSWRHFGAHEALEEWHGRGVPPGRARGSGRPSSLALPAPTDRCRSGTLAAV